MNSESHVQALRPAQIRPKTLILPAFLLYVLAAGVDRMVWLHSGQGVIGAINQSLTQPLGITCKSEHLIEVKPLAEGRMAWRCGLVWPFYTSGDSRGLSALWYGRFSGSE